MAKLSLSKLKLEKNTNIKTITIGDVELEVLQYLPVTEKMELVNISLQESLIGTVCDPILQDTLFHMYLVLMYTNLSLTATQKDNIFETYDILEKNGVISEVVNAIPSNEYNELVVGLERLTEKTEKEMNSVVSIIRDAVDRIPKMIEETQNQLSSLNLDSDTIKEVLAIAKDNGAL